jgi:hypothetical protein
MPIEDIRHRHAIAIGPVAGAIAEEPLGGGVKLRVNRRPAIGRARQRRAADARAIDRKMDARVVVTTAFPDHAMFDFVERNLLAEQRNKRLGPWPLQESAQILDRLDIGISGQDQLDGCRVVNIDEEGKLFGLGPAVKGCAANLARSSQVSFERGAVTRHPVITHGRGNPAAHNHDIALEQRIPAAMVKCLRACRHRYEQQQQ